MSQVVVQVRTVENIKHVEVLDTDCFERKWRVVWRDADVRIGDHLWWQSCNGYLSRDGEFFDKNIGRCEQCTNKGTTETNPEFSKQYERRFRPTKSERKRGES